MDRRINKTETAIEQAFLELTEEKGFVNVKLVDIAERANVNRNTIYLRYGTKEDIIYSILTKCYKKGLELIQQSKPSNTRNNKKKLEVMFLSIFKIIEEDEDLYRMVLTDVNLTGYLTKLTNEIRSDILSRLKETTQNKVVVEYIVQGVSGIVKQWVIYDTGTAEENAKLLSNLVMTNIRYLSFK